MWNSEPDTGWCQEGGLKCGHGCREKKIENSPYKKGTFFLSYSIYIYKKEERKRQAKKLEVKTKKN